MARKPTYEELEQRVKELKKEAIKFKHLEELLFREKYYSESIIESLPGIFYFVDDTDKILRWNKNLEKVSGYSAEEISSMSSLDFIKGEDKHNVEDKIQEVFIKGESFVEADFVSKNGKKTPYYFTGVLIQMDNKNHLGGLGINIAERKQTEEALRESEGKLNAMLQSIGDYVSMMDKDLNIIWANETAKKTFGDNIIGKKCYEAFHQKEEPCEPYPCFTLKAFQDEKVHEHDTQLIDKDGKILSFHCTANVALKDKEGKPKAVLEISREVTERKQAEEALRESEQKYRFLVENLPSTVYRGYKDWSVEFFDNKIEIFTGYNVDEFNSERMKWSDIIVKEDIKTARQSFIRALKTDKSYVREYRIKSKAGDIHWIQERGHIVCDSKGEIEYVTGTFFDNTDRKLAEEEKKKLEAQLQRVQKMEALGTLAGGVAHDLNNMLSGIVGYPDLLLMQIPEDSPLRKSILSIQDSGKKAAAIVQDLLTLARRGVDITEVVNLNDIILEYLKSPEHEKLKLYHPGVEIETNIESDLLNISGSSVHLSKTVMNLVSNAAEAMPAGGKIFISAENRYISRPINSYDSIEEGDYITLMVSDTGIGISKKDLERIFEPFYTKKVMGRSGTGLGMAVVWGTVKDHKGYIDVQSTEGKGSTFTLYFPASREKMAKEESILPVEDYMGKGESILVVDDVKGQRELALTMLTALGYSAHAVSSGEEAVEYLKEHSVDLIVLDMIMDPGIDGLDTYRKILEMHPGQKAIIASGFSETERVGEARRIGAGAYVKKPYTLEQIGLAVKAELEK